MVKGVLQSAQNPHRAARGSRGSSAAGVGPPTPPVGARRVGIETPSFFRPRRTRASGRKARREAPRKAAPSLKRVWTDDFPAVALAEFIAFVVVDRSGAFQELLDVAAGGGRGVQKQDAAGFAAGVLPGMRDVAREERAGAGAADGNIVADLKGDLAGEHPGDLVAVAV